MTTFRHQRQILRGLLLTGQQNKGGHLLCLPEFVIGDKFTQTDGEQSGRLNPTLNSPLNQSPYDVCLEFTKRTKDCDHIDPQDVVDVGLSRLARHLGFPVCKRLILPSSTGYCIATVLTPPEAKYLESFPDNHSGNVDVNEVLLNNEYFLPRYDFLALACFNLWAGNCHVKPEHLSYRVFQKKCHAFLGIEQKDFHAPHLHSKKFSPHKFDHHLYDETKLPLQHAWRKILCQLACRVITSCPNDFIYRHMARGIHDKKGVNAAEIATDRLVERKKHLPRMLKDMKIFINS